MAGSNYILAPDVSVPVAKLSTIPITPDSGRYIARLMEALIKKEDMCNMSRTGSVPNANKSKPDVQPKEPMPVNLQSAIVGNSVDLDIICHR